MINIHNIRPKQLLRGNSWAIEKNTGIFIAFSGIWIKEKDSIKRVREYRTIIKSLKASSRGSFNFGQF